MTLKFKRNFPLVLILIGILLFMVIGMGSQHITSYTVTPETLQTWRPIFHRSNLTMCL